MAIIRWDNSYSVNINEIDAQHKQFFFIINDLQREMCAGPCRHVLTRVFKKMNEHAVTHFKTEEYYFAKFSYAETDRHIQEHLKFERQTEEFKRYFAENDDLALFNRYLSAEVLKFLNSWRVEHISGTDRKYAECFRENGLV